MDRWKRHATSINKYSIEKLSTLKRFLRYLRKRELNKRILTFIWEEYCKEGYSFIYEGMATECRGCSLAPVCHSNLIVHRTYRISRLRDKVVECKAFGRRARLVEVEEAILEAAIRPELAIEGAVIKFQPQTCSEVRCQYYERCSPAALKGDDSCKVVKTGKGFKCPKSERRLVEVSLLLY